MAKKGEQAASDPIREALEQVTQSLNAANELLRGLGLRSPEGGRRSIEAARERPQQPDSADASAPPAGLAAAAEDEGLLRDLAGSHGLEVPVERLIAQRNSRYPDSRPRYWGIVNFDLHSARPRLFVFDVADREVVSYLCAHGSGSEGPSDDGYANVFSNTPGSEASSLGVYRCAETYESDDNGHSLRLDGLEPSNSNARSRLIVMHGAWYVSEAFAKANGRIGRSNGCPALDHAYARTVINQLKRGSFLLHWKTP
jgi:hypothetical protein